MMKVPYQTFCDGWGMAKSTFNLYATPYHEAPLVHRVEVTNSLKNNVGYLCLCSECLKRTQKDHVYKFTVFGVLEMVIKKSKKRIKNAHLGYHRKEEK